MMQWLGLKKSEIDFDKVIFILKKILKQGAKSRSKILVISTKRFDVENIREKLLKCLKDK